MGRGKESLGRESLGRGKYKATGVVQVQAVPFFGQNSPVLGHGALGRVSRSCCFPLPCLLSPKCEIPPRAGLEMIFVGQEGRKSGVGLQPGSWGIDGSGCGASIGAFLLKCRLVLFGQGALGAVISP